MSKNILTGKRMRLAIDIGGTFTDLVLEKNKNFIYKKSLHPLKNQK